MRLSPKSPSASTRGAHIYDRFEWAKLQRQLDAPRNSRRRLVLLVLHAHRPPQPNDAGRNTHTELLRSCSRASLSSTRTLTRANTHKHDLCVCLLACEPWRVLLGNVDTLVCGCCKVQCTDFGEKLYNSCQMTLCRPTRRQRRSRLSSR